MKNSSVNRNALLLNSFMDTLISDTKIGGVTGRRISNRLMKEVTKMSTGPVMKALIKQSTRTTRAEGMFADYVRELECRDIGPDVYLGDMQDSMLSDISAVCRRAFRKNNVIVYVGIETDDDFDEGMVFTTEGIFYWSDNGNRVNGIKYSEITNVDYDETDIIIEYDNTSVSISLGDDAEDEKYPRHMYSFIMDILEYEENSISTFNEASGVSENISLLKG